ncbi:UNVERIFIED_CONTAM: hypothetical protein FKN15_037954 [Acipenser sinensis]
MNTRCPPKRVPSAARFFTHCELTVQPPQSYSVGGQRSSGQLTGKPAGARPDYRGRWCAVSRGHPDRPVSIIELQRMDGGMDICLVCLEGEEWCFAIGEVGHVSPDCHPPHQEVEVEVAA